MHKTKARAESHLLAAEYCRSTTSYCDSDDSSACRVGSNMLLDDDDEPEWKLVLLLLLFMWLNEAAEVLEAAVAVVLVEAKLSLENESESESEYEVILSGCGDWVRTRASHHNTRRRWESLFTKMEHNYC